jgi:hypothetical protein
VAGSRVGLRLLDDAIFVLLDAARLARSFCWLADGGADFTDTLKRDESDCDSSREYILFPAKFQVDVLGFWESLAC